MASDDDDLVEQFSESDLRAWKKFAAAESQYHLGRFYHFEAQRQLRDREILDALSIPDPERVDEENFTRIVEYKYSNQPLSSVGSLYSGGRFNIGDDVAAKRLRPFPALYIGSDYDTAYHERFGVFRPTKGTGSLRPHELALQEPDSFTSCRLNVKLQRLFDLSQIKNLRPYASVEAKFGLPGHLRALEKTIGHKSTPKSLGAKAIRKTLMSIDWRFLPTNFGIPAAPQVFGRAIRQAGYEGILFRSTKGPGNCIAVYPENLLPGSSIELADDMPDPDIAIQATLTADNFEALQLR